MRHDLERQGPPVLNHAASALNNNKYSLIGFLGDSLRNLDWRVVCWQRLLCRVQLATLTSESRVFAVDRGVGVACPTTYVLLKQAYSRKVGVPSPARQGPHDKSSQLVINRCRSAASFRTSGSVGQEDIFVLVQDLIPSRHAEPQAQRLEK